MAGKRTILAAGGIIWRPNPNASSGGIEVLLVHRPHYDDWTFPKGKSDPGEVLQATAVREILEETQLSVRLGYPLSPVDYEVSSGPKQVHYWMARVIGSTKTNFNPNREVDQLRWVKPRRAAQLLTYRHDRVLLDEFRRLRDTGAHKAQALLLLRHATAQSRAKFAGEDLLRPLSTTGVRQSQRLISTLSAYRPALVLSSPAARCVGTVSPYAASLGTSVDLDDRLREDASYRKVKRLVSATMDSKQVAVACSHAPTLDAMLKALNVPSRPIRPSEGLVVHHRKGRVLTIEPAPIRAQRSP